MISPAGELQPPIQLPRAGLRPLGLQAGKFIRAQDATFGVPVPTNLKPKERACGEGGFASPA